MVYASIAAFTICALSLTVLTGWAGQLSVGQIAFAGLGWWDGPGCVGRLVRIERRIRPDVTRTRARDRLYPSFQRLHATLRPVNDELGASVR